MAGGLLSMPDDQPAGQQPFSADPRTMGLLGVAAGLLQAGGPQDRRVSLGQALGQGLQSGVQYMGQAQQMGQQDDLARTRKLMAKIQAAQLQMAGQKMEQEQARQREIAGIIGQLPANQQGMARLDPEAFAKRQIEMTFPEALSEDKRYRTVGNSLVDLKTGKPVYNAPFAPQMPDRTLVEVYDPSSPTGTKMVPRSDAVGKPGAPPSGTSISYDEQGRPVITMGRQQPKAADGIGTLPADMAGKAAALQSTAKNLEGIRDFFFPDGQFNRTGAAAVAGGSVGQLLDGRSGEVSTKIAGAIDTMIRLRTGAAATKDEIDSYMKMYVPGPMDNTATARAKLDQLYLDIGTSLDEVNRSRKGGGAPKDAVVPSIPVAPNDPSRMGPPAPALSQRKQDFILGR